MINQLTPSLPSLEHKLSTHRSTLGPRKLPTRLLLNIYAQMPRCRMPVHSHHRQQLAREGYLEGIPRQLRSITLGPPSTMSATTGTPWPIPALKKEKKRKKREKNTKPANQRNKKRNKKHKLKLLSMGEGNNIWRANIQSENVQKTL